MGAYINFDLVDTAELCGINIKRSTLTNDEVEARCPTAATTVTVCI